MTETNSIPPGYMGEVTLPPLSPPTTEARDRAIPLYIREASAQWTTQVVIDPADHAPRLAGLFLRCSVCGQAILRLSYGIPEPGQVAALHHTPAELETATLAHVLQVHRKTVDPQWSGT